MFTAWFVSLVPSFCVRVVHPLGFVFAANTLLRNKCNVVRRFQDCPNWVENSGGRTGLIERRSAKLAWVLYSCAAALSGGRFFLRVSVG